MTITGTTSSDPATLRAALVDQLAQAGAFTTPAIADAFGRLPREVFLPGVDLAIAYSRKPVVTKRGADGSALSSASAPGVVATMLGQLDPQPGQRILEIGAATGINAALLADLVGPTGTVVTVEIDQDLTDGARAALDRAGYPDVVVVCGDGAHGYPERAPYDGLIVTAGAWDIPPAWWEQLAIGARLVAPVVLHGSGLTRSLPFDHVQPGLLVSTRAQTCGFVPMRGFTEHTGPAMVAVGEGVGLSHDPADQVDAAALGHALAGPGTERWSGAVIDQQRPGAHLDLWLATTGSGYGRLGVSDEARARGVDPTRRWAGAAVVDGGALAYLVLRNLDAGREEIGVIAHGPHAERLANRTIERVRDWHQRGVDQPTVTAVPGDAPKSPLPTGGHRIDKPHARLTVNW